MASEVQTARRLCRMIRNMGGDISIYTEGECGLFRSRCRKTTESVLGICDEQEIVARKAETGERLAWFLLVWGNDPNGSELIADCSDNTFARLCMEALETLERVER